MGHQTRSKQLKRLNAPKHWFLSKMAGAYAPKPRNGPHSQANCIPLKIILRERLRYALCGKETQAITFQRLVKVDGKVRVNVKHPCGFMDVVQIEKTKDQFRLLFSMTRKFRLHRISDDEAGYKLCRVEKIVTLPRGMPVLYTHDRRPIRFFDPKIKERDTVRLEIPSGKIIDYIKFKVGNVSMVNVGSNVGRVGIILHNDVHPSGISFTHLKDAAGNEFTSRTRNVFCIGDGEKPWVSLPKGNGIRLTEVERREKQLNGWD